MSLLERLPDADLGEVLAASGLQTRIDRKYLVRPSEVEDLLGATEGARVLQIEGRRRFRYRSTYCDTPDLASLRGSAHGRRRRFKVRTRTYLDSGERWLEIKTRGLRGVTVKHRTALAGTGAPGTENAPLDGEARARIAEVLGVSQVSGVDVDALAPVITTSYRRSTLLLADGSRCTVDSDLRWCGPDEVCGARTDLVVVETKTPPGAGRCEVDQALAEAGVRPCRLSKYAVGMALLQPTVPANRWHRTVAALGA